MALIYLETFVKLQKRAFVTAYQSPKGALRQACCRWDEQARGAAARGPAGPSKDRLRPRGRLAEAGSWRHQAAPGLSRPQALSAGICDGHRAASARRSLGSRPTPAAWGVLRAGGLLATRLPGPRPQAPPSQAGTLSLGHAERHCQEAPQPRGQRRCFSAHRPPGRAARCQPFLGPQAPHSPDPVQNWK